MVMDHLAIPCIACGLSLTSRDTTDFTVVTR